MDVGCGLLIEVSDAMMRRGWMVYDADGAIIRCGVFGEGDLVTPGKEGAIAAKIVCGVDAFLAIKQATEPRRDAPTPSPAA